MRLSECALTRHIFVYTVHTVPYGQPMSCPTSVWVCTAFAGRLIGFSSAAQRDKCITHECYFWNPLEDHPSSYQLELGGVLRPQTCQRFRLLPPHPLHLCSVC